MRDVIPILIPALCAVAGAGVLAWGWFAHQRGQASRAWPSTNGKVVSSGVAQNQSSDSDGSSRTSYYPDVSYSYEVGGSPLESSRIGVGGVLSAGSHNEAARIAGQYAVGSTVKVYYDPTKPEYAVLVPGGNSKLLLSLVAGGVIFLVMAVVMAVMLKR